MRDVAAYIADARSTITSRRELSLSELRTLIDDYYNSPSLYGKGGLFDLIGASFYFGFAVGMRQAKARK